MKLVVDGIPSSPYVEHPYINELGEQELFPDLALSIQPMFSLKEDNELFCKPDSDGFCECTPVQYMVRGHASYAMGNICEACYLVRGIIRGVKSEMCYHGD